jgi:hypothetical protein
LTAALSSFESPKSSDTIESTPAVIDRVEAELPPRFPPRVFETMAKGLRSSARALALMAAKVS